MAAAAALSVYYPFGLVDLLAFQESDDAAQSGEALLVFLDVDGCAVTLRLTPQALDALRKRIPASPDPRPK